MKLLTLALAIALLSTNQLPAGEKMISGAQSFELSQRERQVLQKRAEKGDADAAFKLHRYFDVVKLSTKEARHWLKKAAAGGHVVAQYNLAMMLLDEGANAEAKKWLKAASAQGDKAAADALKRLP